jgi:electron transport complex protein RnfE
MQSTRWLVVALCPAVAMSDTLASAFGIGVALMVSWMLVALTAALPASLPARVIHALRMLLLATVVGCISLWLDAGLHGLYGTLAFFLPLLVANLALLALPPGQSVRTALINAARRGFAVLIVLVILGTARELVGRGSLLHAAEWTGFDRIQLFPSDMGFLLAMLPPGAFIALGLLLAVRNWLLNRHRHEPDQNR